MLRSGGMGEFVFSPPGLDEALLRTGFGEIQVQDRTPNMTAVAGAWRSARAPRAAARRDRGREANVRFQDFLGAVERLASERRLSRLGFLARKPAAA